MVAPVAAVAGKKAASKAAENPAGSLFLMVLVGAVLIQGVKNLPDLGEFLWNKLPLPDVIAPIEYTIESIKDTWETEFELQQEIMDITPAEDPMERALFGDFSGALGPEDEEQFGFWQTGYRGAREGLFLGMRSPWAPY